MDAVTLRKATTPANRAIIIGGGFIGLELAASLRRNGISVHVLEMADRLLTRAVSPAVARIVHSLHLKNDVKFTFRTKIKELGKTGDKTNVMLGDGSELMAYIVIAGIGSTPETKLAKAAGLAVGNGVVVDENLRTSHQFIFAAGDCCCFPLYGNGGPPTRLEAWQAAGEQGELAGRNMAFDDREKSAYTHVPWFWSEQYDHVLQVSGYPNPDVTAVERAYAADHHVTFSVNSKGEMESACGIAPGTKIAKDIRFSMKLIESKKNICQSDLSRPDVNLKSIVRR